MKATFINKKTGVCIEKDSIKALYTGHRYHFIEYTYGSHQHVNDTGNEKVQTSEYELISVEA